MQMLEKNTKQSVLTLVPHRMRLPRNPILDPSHQRRSLGNNWVRKAYKIYFDNLMNEHLCSGT